MSRHHGRGSSPHGGNSHNRHDDSGDSPNRHGDDSSGGGLLSKLSDVKDKVEGVSDIVGDVKSILEGDPMGVVNLVSDGAQLAQEFLPASYATPIIAGGLTTLNVISKTLGFGNPNAGDDFNEGATALQSTGRGLEQAYPTSWEGSGSSAYGAQNSKQIDRTSTLISADNKVISILKTEAEQVANTRDNMDNISAYLGAAIAPAMALMAIPVGGEPASLAFQAAAVAAAGGASGATMGQMISNAQSNSSQLQQAIAQYQQVSSQAKLGGGSMSGTPSPSTGGPTTGGSPNGSSPTGGSPSGSAPTGGTSSGGGGTSSGGGGTSSGGGGTSSGGGGSAGGSSASTGGSGAAGTSGSGTSSGGGASGGLPGGLLSGLSGGSGSGGGSGGMLGTLGTLAGQVTQAVTQAVSQAEQAQQAEQAEQAQQLDPNAAQNAASGATTEGGAADAAADTDEQLADGAGSDAGGERAPSHIAVGFDAENRSGHVSVGATATPTATPLTTREA